MNRRFVKSSAPNPLDRSATTFPADRDELQRRFNKVDVREDVRLVVDGKFITSVGGGMSYEPALYLVERLYGRASAERIRRLHRRPRPAGQGTWG